MQPPKLPKFVRPRDIHTNYLAKYWYKFLGIVFTTVLLYIGTHYYAN